MMCKNTRTRVHKWAEKMADQLLILAVFFVITWIILFLQNGFPAWG